MRSTLNALLADSNDLQIYVESIEKIYRILSSQQDTTIQECLNIRRRLDYVAFIIALYAALEKFVDDLAWSYAELESSRNQYSSLCKNLQTKHLKQSADLLCRGRLGEGRYTDITEVDIVKNLYTCLSGENPYKLNRHAVVHHDYNMRSKVVQEVFGTLGIKNINTLACFDEIMIDWYYKLEGDESSSKKKIPERVIELRLKDLVDRRNQVAHGGRNQPEVLGTDEMKERLNFLKAYAYSLFKVLSNEYLERYYINSGKAISLGQPIEGPFKGGSVVVIQKPECRIFQGQPIVGVRKKHVDRWGEIMEIQVNDVPVKSIENDSSATDAGLRTDFKLTKGVNLYVLEKKDDVVWG